MRYADLLKWLGERRDGFLVGGAIIYGLGYLVWSYNAWRNHLGQLPAIELQYVIAGLVPALILVIGWVAINFASYIGDKIRGFFEKHRFLHEAWVLVIWLIQVGIIYIWITQPLPMIPWFLVILTYLEAVTTNAGRRIYRYIGRYTPPIFICFLSLLLYLDLYPRLPQEFGGPKPRCAYLDLVRDELAPSSLSVLVADPPNEAVGSFKSKVVRSSKLQVYFLSSDYLLVRTAVDGTRALEDIPLYELRKEVIRVIQWCAD
jgi:hypothetical protein